mmetsp:Transcript_24038/g.26306  ORF Transcript_24038/g.26306 Transcript_24038/m.26306 type:complete len:301 (-) Transcript_24038:260-1162(-)|eukprot:gene12955-14195_t
MLFIVLVSALLVSYTAAYRMQLRMGLDPVLAKAFPRDFKNIPKGTDYGKDLDLEFNTAVENRRLAFLENELYDTLKTLVATRERPIFTTALIAGDNVILDALAKTNLLSKVPIIFVDTFTLFPESLAHLREVENHYGFKSKIYHAAGCKDQQDYYDQYGRDYWMKDIDKYDMLCKVEPMNRALKEHNSDAWINGRRRDHGAERAALPVWEGKKVNPLAFWSFEDCWSYLRKHKVPYHPLHDVGFSSLGDMHSTLKVDHKVWFTYGGERSGRFQNLVNKDGSAKTECGIHTEISTDLNLKK